ncbi:MAG: hypothetical protein ABJA83_01655 [Burkholderiaceae bacterium]
MSVYRLALPIALVATAALAAAPALAGPASVNPADLSAVDQAFINAREAVRIGDRERLTQNAARLVRHPLAAYPEYWLLLGRIRSAEPNVTADVTQFMRRHPDTYIADRLRLD